MDLDELRGRGQRTLQVATHGTVGSLLYSATGAQQRQKGVAPECRARIHAGVAIKDLCRKHGFSDASFYLWRSKFGGMSVSDAKRLKELETENSRLKKLLAESMLENEVTREALRKKW